MMYQSFETLLQLSNWLKILVSSLLLPLFFFHQYKDIKKCKKMKISTSRKSSKEIPEDDGSITSHDTTDTNHADLPNLNEYPMFNHHKLNINDDMIRNRAVYELLKYMGGNAILYCQMSHHKGALIRIPSASSASGYAMMLKKKANFIEDY